MTLFVVHARGTDDEALSRARFVAEGFSFWAFVFSWAWLLFHRLWVAFLLWAALEICFFVFVLPHIGVGTTLTVDVLARLFLGLEGNRMRSARDTRRDGVTELVEARDRDEAETVFYARYRPEGTVARETGSAE